MCTDLFDIAMIFNVFLYHNLHLDLTFVEKALPNQSVIPHRPWESLSAWKSRSAFRRKHPWLRTHFGCFIDSWAVWKNSLWFISGGLTNQLILKTFPTEMRLLTRDHLVEFRAFLCWKSLWPLEGISLQAYDCNCINDTIAFAPRIKHSSLAASFVFCCYILGHQSVYVNYGFWNQALKLTSFEPVWFEGLTILQNCYNLNFQKVWIKTFPHKN